MRKFSLLRQTISIKDTVFEELSAEDAIQLINYNDINNPNIPGIISILRKSLREGVLYTSESFLTSVQCKLLELASITILESNEKNPRPLQDEIPEEDKDISFSFLAEADTVGSRYGLTPMQVLAEFSPRQIHICYKQISDMQYSDSAFRATLAGGKMKYGNPITFALGTRLDRASRIFSAAQKRRENNG